MNANEWICSQGFKYVVVRLVRMRIDIGRQLIQS
jgi:hypothetical protein